MRKFVRFKKKKKKKKRKKVSEIWLEETLEFYTFLLSAVSGMEIRKI